jgi:histidine triad (HIT) family protein
MIGLGQGVSMPERTIFEKILASEIPSAAVYENEWVYAFKDIAPAAPVHVLVIPKQKTSGIARLHELSPESILEFFKALPVVAEKLNLQNGYRVVINEGKDGNQAVPYLHAHILGGRALAWPPG